jgi:PAS domain S-box-containing protein
MCPIPIAIMVAAMVAVSLFLLVVTAAPLDRAHQEIDASRARAQSLVEQAPDGIFVANLDGRYTEVNEAGCRLLQYSRGEIVGKTIFDLIPSEDVGRLIQSKDLLLRGQQRRWRVATSPQGRQLPRSGGEREDSAGRAVAGVRARHQRAQTARGRAAPLRG